jgi:group I intron endonuclease
MYIIYQMINTINSKDYIGFTTTSVEERWSQHKSSAKHGARNHFHDAIKKHGPDVWMHRILCWGEDHDSGLRIAEPLMIEIFKPKYNETKGGEGVLGYKPSPEANAERSARMTGITKGPYSPEHCQRISESLRGNKNCQGKKNAMGHRWSIGQKAKKSHKWEIISPTGEISQIVNLREFCRNNGLNNGHMVQVAKGRVTHHKQWTCRKI